MIDSPTHPGERLKALREARGLSLRRTAQLSEGAISHSHVNDLEKGFASWEELSFVRIRGLSRAFGLSPSKLVELIEGSRDLQVDSVRVYRVPVVEEGKGVPRWNEGEPQVTVTLLDGLVHREDALFAVRVGDEAMRGYAAPGDTVIVDSDRQAELGEVVALQLPGKGIVIRRYRGFSEAGRYLVTADGTGEFLEAPRNSRLWGVAVGVWRFGAK